MPIAGLGIDLLHVPRIARLTERYGAARFARRILSPIEWETWNALAPDKQTPFLATRFVMHQQKHPLGERRRRWAAKEAAFKACNSLRFRDVTVRSAASGAPGLETALDGPRGLAWHVSWSHDGEWLTAVALAETT